LIAVFVCSQTHNRSILLLSPLGVITSGTAEATLLATHFTPLATSPATFIHAFATFIQAFNPACIHSLVAYFHIALNHAGTQVAFIAILAMYNQAFNISYASGLSSSNHARAVSRSCHCSIANCANFLAAGVCNNAFMYGDHASIAIFTQGIASIHCHTVDKTLPAVVSITLLVNSSNGVMYCITPPTFASIHPLFCFASKSSAFLFVLFRSSHILSKKFFSVLMV
jgi:hypothetical protein